MNAIQKELTYLNLQLFNDLYLDYINNFMTVESFASYYGFNLDFAEFIVETGRAISGRLVELDN